MGLSDRARPNNRHVRPVALVLLTVPLWGLCTGCASSERAPDAAAVVERFQVALERGNGEAACAEVGEETRTALEQQDGRPCARAILALDLPSGGTGLSTSVYVTSASVALDEGGTLFLDQAADGWEIAAAGCRPTAPDLPYDCELEG